MTVQTAEVHTTRFNGAGPGILVFRVDVVVEKVCWVLLNDCHEGFMPPCQVVLRVMKLHQHDGEKWQAIQHLAERWETVHPMQFARALREAADWTVNRHLEESNEATALRGVK